MIRTADEHHGDRAGAGNGCDSEPIPGGAGDLVPGRGPAEGLAPERRLGLGQGYGVEIEYMIVDAETLDVRPVADRLFTLMGWAPGASDLEVEGVAWSNELALHVLEMKTPGPVRSLGGLGHAFQKSVKRADRALADLGFRLLPGGAHPWMDPAREFRIWPHEYTEVYRTYDRIFSCRGHGWANLQSTHLNLPFGDDTDFRLLHEAIRVVLPLIPALSASSPILEGRVGPALDNRLLAYRNNARRVPSVTGSVVPETIRSEAEYRTLILDPVYRDLGPLDPEGILRHEWVNSRGAIARFDRGSVEIRVVDAQESPRMDLAVTAAVAFAVLRATVAIERETEVTAGFSTTGLARLLDRTVHTGRRTSLEPGDGNLYRRVLDLPERPQTVGGLWEALLAQSTGGSAEERAIPLRDWQEELEVLLREGSLAERILADLEISWPGSSGEKTEAPRLSQTYRRLADTLREGGIFRARPPS